MLEDTMHIGHVGDGRVYVLFNNGEFKQITEDETNAWLSYKQGHFKSPDEIKIDPSSRGLKNAIGALDSIKAKQYSLNFQEIDTVLLASDGFYKCLLDNEIKQTLILEKDPVQALKTLVNITKDPQGIIPLAMELNGYDEETVRAILNQDSKSAILMKRLNHQK